MKREKIYIEAGQELPDNLCLKHIPKWSNASGRLQTQLPNARTGRAEDGYYWKDYCGNPAKGDFFDVDGIWSHVLDDIAKVNLGYDSSGDVTNKKETMDNLFAEYNLIPLCGSHFYRLTDQLYKNESYIRSRVRQTIEKEERAKENKQYQKIIDKIANDFDLEDLELGKYESYRDDNHGKVTMTIDSLEKISKKYDASPHATIEWFQVQINTLENDNQKLQKENEILSVRPNFITLQRKIKELKKENEELKKKHFVTEEEKKYLDRLKEQGL